MTLLRRMFERWLEHRATAAVVGVWTSGMAVVPHPQKQPRLTVVSPQEALRRALPLPSDADMAIDGLTEDEWTAFEKALAER